ncbi:metallophosphoesterase [Caldalkalibacillus salinus]|uniref:metallophosphoesterase n=1 Tax=Caldalkalibacillus salinus TaxID=2803787 RepID=UPI001922C902|nr:metallophosphoesterase [Caldalkalibacillus salinus]
MNQWMNRGMKGLGIIIVLMLALAIYTYWDNQRIVVVEEEVKIDDLPSSLEGYTILQITDLHDKTFGEKQQRLVETINAIDYDAILLTGDMTANGFVDDYAPFYDILEGIDNKEIALFSSGNSDPNSYTFGDDVYEETEFIKGMKSRGVNLLESVEEVQVGDASVNFVDFNMSSRDPEDSLAAIEAELANKENNHASGLRQHQKQLFEEMQTLDYKDDQDVLIAVRHYPVLESDFEFISNRDIGIQRDYDLIVAGHYHGGQIRIPFYGALYIPEQRYPRRGYFPPQDRVKGLWEVNGFKQYVSAGLGHVDTIPLLSLRFFNPPEVNVLTLTKNRE